MNNLINNPEYDKIEEDLRNEASKLKKQYKYNPERDWWLKKGNKVKINALITAVNRELFLHSRST
jgi:hypothetical protein